MDYKLTIDMPNQAPGALIQIAGLGTYENGSENVITEAEHDNFRRYHGRSDLQYNENNEVIGSELVLGPTLIQAEIYGVKVESYKETAAEKKAREEAEKKAADEEAEAAKKAADTDSSEGVEN